MFSLHCINSGGEIPGLTHLLDNTKVHRAGPALQAYFYVFFRGKYFLLRILLF